MRGIICPVLAGALACMIAAAPALSADAAATGALTVKFEGLRSAKGLVRVCLTRDPKLYLHCDRDPISFRASVAAGAGRASRSR